MVDTLDARIQFISAPVRDELEQVVDALRRLATEGGVSELTAPLGAASFGAGKKLRPMLTLLASRFHECDSGPVVTMATAVELLHIASLIHDDTVDNSATRRGRATIGTLWGGNVAVLLGDYIFATSAVYVCDTRNVRVIRRFSKTIMDLARGQLSEHFSTHNWHQTLAEYEVRTYNKTASLFCTAGESGAVLSGATDEHVDLLKAYGYQVGMAFQIKDDVLDFEGEEGELGKPVGNDLLQGTLTLPALFMVRRYPNDPIVRRLLGGSTDTQDLYAAVEMVRNSSAIEEALSTAGAYRERAVSLLRQLPPNRARESLEELTDYITQRRA